MRLKREMALHLSKIVIDRLTKAEAIQLDCRKEKVVDEVAQVFLDQIKIEEDLNQEVKELLVSHGTLIDQTNVNYNKMFNMVKQKLAKERGIVL
jgi:hypothetical protein